MSTRFAAIFACVAALWPAILLSAQPRTAEDTPAVAHVQGTPVDALEGIPIRGIRERLEGLSPADPEGYFLLAEELAGETPVSESSAGLARRLFVLAFVLAERTPPDPERPDESSRSLRASCCLALAWLADDPDSARWLRALATSIDLRRSAPTWDPPTAGVPESQVVLDLCTALGHLRAGDGRRALRLLDNPRVLRLLEKYDDLLDPAGISGGADRIIRLSSRWDRCSECNNERFTRDPDGTHLCTTCGGDPSPNLTLTEVFLQLRLESELLSGIHESWAAQVQVDEGAPLRDLDPEELPILFGIDTSAVLYQDGAWVEPAPPAPPIPPAPHVPPAPPGPEPRQQPAPGDDTTSLPSTHDERITDTGVQT